MTNRHICSLARFGGLLAGATLICQSALAVPFGNPFPGLWEDDIDGIGLFTPDAVTLFTETLDVFDTSAEFGFFSASTPGTLVPIFEANDLAGETALVDFSSGFVFDTEDGVGQNVFTPVTGPIGFYLDIPLVATLYSLPALNFGGLDGFGAYPTVGSGDFNLLFAVPGTAPSLDQLLSWHTAQGAQGLTPVEAEVPAPLPLALIGLGVALFGARSIRRTS